MGKQNNRRRDECSHLISAKLTEDAFEIYKWWRGQRLGGRKISNAICAFENADSQIKREREELRAKERKLVSDNINQRSEIENMKKNISAIQKIITRTFIERDEIAAELSEMFAPQRPE